MSARIMIDFLKFKKGLETLTWDIRIEKLF